MISSLAVPISRPPKLRRHRVPAGFNSELAGRSTTYSPSWSVTTSTAGSTVSSSSEANARVAPARTNRTLRPAAGVPSGRVIVSVTWVMCRPLLGEDVLDDVGAAAVRHLDEILDRPEPFAADDRASPQRVGRVQIR